MKFHPDWRRILRKAWSVRLAIVAGLFSGLELALPLFQDMIPRGLFAGLSVAAAISATVARFVYQSSMHDESEHS